MKQIAYTIIDNGIEGTEPDDVVAAFWDETARDEALNKSKNKNYLRVGEVIVDLEKRKVEALAQLDGIDKLVLGLVPKAIVSRH